MTPHVRRLLDDLSGAEADLAEATTAAQADAARADIAAIQHSLWLAGWRAEEPQGEHA